MDQCQKRPDWLGLSKDASINDKDVVFFIHLNTIETETGLWGLFIAHKNCLFSSLYPSDPFR